MSNYSAIKAVGFLTIISLMFTRTFEHTSSALIKGCRDVISHEKLKYSAVLWCNIAYVRDVTDEPIILLLRMKPQSSEEQNYDGWYLLKTDSVVFISGKEAIKYV